MREKQARWFCPGRPRGDEQNKAAANAVGKAKSAKPQQGFPSSFASDNSNFTAATAVSEVSEFPSGMSIDEKSNLFSKAYRQLEIATEKRIQKRAAMSDDRSVLHPEEGDQDLSGFEGNRPWAGSFASSIKPPQDESEDQISRFGPLSEEGLQELWRQLQQRELPSFSKAFSLIEQTVEHLKKECSACVRVPKPEERIIIVGDLHGHISDFWHVYTHFGHPSAKNMYLFNGDFVDRGIWGPEVIFAIFVLRLMCPKHVFLNRGNHESEICTRFYGFQTHLACAYPDEHQELYELIHRAFNQLPLCHIIDERVFVVHAGLPPYIPMIAELDEIKRGPVPHPAKTRHDEIFTALIWSDPRSKTGESDRGIGWHFSPQLTNNFCQWNNLDYIVRSHEVVDGGFQEMHGGLVKTVFSASNYDETNNANVLLIDSALHCTPSVPWNEEYIPKDWMQDASAAAEEFDVAVLESFGGDFTTVHVDFIKQEGAIFGFLLNAENPTLQLPVITELRDAGLVADYNEAHRENPVMLGDAILDVNGEGGYNALKAALAEGTTLNFRFRRPQPVHVKLSAQEAADLPAASALCYPTHGFAFCLDVWGPMTRVDRLREVNGKTMGEEMRHELMKKDTDFDMVLFRYAPEAYVPERQDEVIAKEVRNRAVSDWSSADQVLSRASTAVRRRLRTLEGYKSQGDQQERVLHQLHTMIYLNRATLLERFQMADKRSCSFLEASQGQPNWNGSVTKEKWCQVMRGVLDLGADFNWKGLRPFLCSAQDDVIEYVSFLLRYQNPLSRWLLFGWCGGAIDQLAYKLQGTYAALWERLDSDGLGKLDFGQFRNFIMGYLWEQASNKVEQEYQEVLVFALFRYMNNNSAKAAVTRADFRRTFTARKTNTSTQCPRGHVLDRHPSESCCPEKYYCDDCKEECKLMWMTCERCDFDLCLSCVHKRREKDAQHDLTAKGRRERLRMQWDNVRHFTETLSESLVEVQDLFVTPTGKLEVIDKPDFIGIVRDIFPEDQEAPGELFESVIRYLKDQGDTEHPTHIKHMQTTKGMIEERTTFTLQELVDSLAVQDTTTSSSLYVQLSKVSTT